MSNSMENCSSLIDKMVGEMDQIKTRYQKQMQDEFKKVVALFFESHPEVERIVWTQYTPYFNDGEACYFSVNEMCSVPSKIKEVPSQYECGIEESLTYGDAYGLKYDLATIAEDLDKPNNYFWYSEDEEALIDKDLDVLNKIPDEVFEQMFGDHVRISATRTGFEVEPYEHD